ncbi:MAG: hypothetical protein H6658_10015 [Ardenticatenaceae bacterium]|nr:hypothetical protein [Ardenticatenaceae bacterium]
MSCTGTIHQRGCALLYQVLLIFLMVWEVFVSWVVTAVSSQLFTRQPSHLRPCFSLLNLWPRTAVPYAAYPLSCCLLE